MIIAKDIRNEFQKNEIQKLSSQNVVFENSNITSYYYNKIARLTLCNIILNTLSIIISVNIFDFTNQKDSENSIIFNMEYYLDFMLVLSSILMTLQLILDYSIQRNNILYNIYQGREKRKCNLKNKVYLLPLSLFIFTSLCHPNYIFYHYIDKGGSNQLKYYNKITQSYLYYTYNDLITFLGLLKVVSIIYHYFWNISYNNDKASRCWYLKKQNKWFQKDNQFWYEMFIQTQPFQINCFLVLSYDVNFCYCYAYC